MRARGQLWARRVLRALVRARVALGVGSGIHSTLEFHTEALISLPSELALAFLYLSLLD